MRSVEFWFTREVRRSPEDIHREIKRSREDRFTTDHPWRLSRNDVIARRDATSLWVGALARMESDSRSCDLLDYQIRSWPWQE